MARALILVDIQQDYFPGGRHPLEGADDAAAHAARLLESARSAGDTVVHVRHLWDAPDAEYLQAGTPGCETHPAVAPAGDEAVVEKTHPNSFLETPLEALLRDRGVDELVVCGMMTSMCVDATVRAAVDLGFRTTVAHDACATCALEFGSTPVPAQAVHAAFLAALADGYADVAATDELVATAPAP